MDSIPQVWSEGGAWYVACAVASLMNQVLIVRYLIRIGRTQTLGLWQVWGVLAAVTIAVDKLLIDSGYLEPLLFMTVLLFVLDLAIFRLGLQK
jgi:hypothetical protein